MPNHINVDPQEIAKFEKMAATWWDLNGEFKPLHKLNPLRLDFIDKNVSGLFGKRVLDVGCGGGILSEGMARLGAKVEGLDMGSEPLEVARLHALSTALEIDYIQNTAEEHRDEHREVYDVITCMEMLEHVPDPSSVIKACAEMVKPGGQVFFSTINRNLRAYIETIIGAEYLLKMLPVGTHDHHKYIKPAELMSMAESVDLLCNDAMGITYNPITGVFRYTKRLDVNYMIATVKMSITKTETITGVLFDLDGTLVDTAPDLVDALNFALQDFNYPTKSIDEVRDAASNGSLALIDRAQPNLDDEERTAIQQAVLQHYQRINGDRAQFFDGIQTLLDDLSQHNIPFGVVTNKPARFARPLLDRLDLVKAMKTIISGDSTCHSKPSPAPMLIAAQQLECLPTSIIYVGDALRDLQAARNSRMLGGVAHWGYIAKDDDPSQWPQDFYFNHPREIMVILKKLNSVES